MASVCLWRFPAKVGGNRSRPFHHRTNHFHPIDFSLNRRSFLETARSYHSHQSKFTTPPFTLPIRNSIVNLTFRPPSLLLLQSCRSCRVGRIRCFSSSSSSRDGSDSCSSGGLSPRFFRFISARDRIRHFLHPCESRSTLSTSSHTNHPTIDQQNNTQSTPNNKVGVKKVLRDGPLDPSVISVEEAVDAEVEARISAADRRQYGNKNSNSTPTNESTGREAQPIPFTPQAINEEKKVTKKYGEITITRHDRFSVSSCCLLTQT